MRNPSILLKASASILLTLTAMPAVGQEKLTNPSFESPVAPANGNNLYTSIAGWTIVAAGNPAQPVNLVKPTAAYTGGPTAPPTGGGLQYFDVNQTSGVLSQTITLATAGTVNWGGWFSMRDNPFAQAGCIIRIKDSSGTVIASQEISFASTDSLQTWKRAGGNNLPVTAGTYTFEWVIPNPINADLGTFFFFPAPTIVKSGTTVFDPFNGTTNPKAIPGAAVRYGLKVANPGTMSINPGTQNLADATPAGMSLIVSGTYQPSFTPSTSGMTFTYSSPTSTTDDVDFSNNGGSTWTYSPTADAQGRDSTVTNVRFRPQGTMAATSDYTLNVSYSVR